jgi:hypothetical protein
VTIVGYGVSTDKAFVGGVRRSAPSKITKLNPLTIGTATSNACTGDTGGAALMTVSGKTTLIGLVTDDWGVQKTGGKCVYDGYIRVNEHHNALFLKQFVTDAAPVDEALPLPETAPVEQLPASTHKHLTGH